MLAAILTALLVATPAPRAGTPPKADRAADPAELDELAPFRAHCPTWEVAAARHDAALGCLDWLRSLAHCNAGTPGYAELLSEQAAICEAWQALARALAPPELLGCCCPLCWGRDRARLRDLLGEDHYAAGRMPCPILCH